MLWFPALEELHMYTICTVWAHAHYR